MKLTDRQRKLLWIVVHDHIATAEPIGSTSIIKKYDLSCSSATCRNELVTLEKEGYLLHPHTSAGRIPTDSGYRFYVDRLMKVYSLTNREKSLIDQMQRSLEHDLECLTEHTMKTLTSISSYTTLMSANADLLEEVLGHINDKVSKAKRERIYLSGISRMLYQPEFENISNARSVMKALDERERVLELLDNCCDDEKASVLIGEELIDKDLKGCSLVKQDFHYKGKKMGTLGIIGPTRMKYSKVTVAVNSIAKVLDDLLECL